MKKGRYAAQRLTDLTGQPFTTAVRWIERKDFKFHSATRGGYRRFRHTDGSEIWIRPSGEIVRMGPKLSGKKQRARYDKHGRTTPQHSTGETIGMP